MTKKNGERTRVVALVNAKGGTGKTTSAMYLAAVAAARGQSALVADADPQGDAQSWAQRADLPFDTEAVTPDDIAFLHDAYREGDGNPYRWVFLDVPPYGSAMGEALRHADFVVIPSDSSTADLDQTASLQDLCDREGVPNAVLLIRSERRTTSYRSARQWLADNQRSVFDTDIAKNQEIKMAKGTPLARTFEYRDAFDELSAAMSEAKEG